MRNFITCRFQCSQFPNSKMRLWALLWHYVSGYEKYLRRWGWWCHRPGYDIYPCRISNVALNHKLATSYKCLFMWLSTNQITLSMVVVGHTCIHIYINTYMHAYIHTYIHIFDKTTSTSISQMFNLVTDTYMLP